MEIIITNAQEAGIFQTTLSRCLQLLELEITTNNQFSVKVGEQIGIVYTKTDSPDYLKFKEEHAADAIYFAITKVENNNGTDQTNMLLEVELVY